MKYLKTINELVKNPKLVKLTIKQMFKELEFLNLNLNILSLEKEYYVYLNYKILNRSKVYLEQTLNILKKYKKIFLKIDYILSFEYDIDSDNDSNEIFNLEFFIKNSKTIRIKPNKIVYHYSPSKNRESILKYGLTLQKFKNSKEWMENSYLEYEDSIFAVNGHHVWHELYDCWEIDTTNLKNKWWMDLNFNNKVNKKYIMTFEPIPPEFLKLNNNKSINFLYK